jgi:hypothetical protein
MEKNKITDLYYHLRSLTKRRIEISDRISQLQKPLSDFIHEFSHFESQINRVRDEIIVQQTIENNCIGIKNKLELYLDTLEADQKISQIIRSPSNLTAKFDEFTKAMQELETIKLLLCNFSSPDSIMALKRLNSLFQDGNNKMMALFRSKISNFLPSVPISLFHFINEEFIISNPKYETDYCYPFERNELHQINRLARILETHNQESIVSFYTSIRFKSLIDTINPLLKEASIRSISSGPLNIILIPKYKPRSHPFILLTNVIWYLFQREIDIISIIFDGMPRSQIEALKYLFEEIYKAFLSALDKISVSIVSHIDILLDLDISGALSDLIISFSKFPEEIKLNIVENIQLNLLVRTSTIKDHIKKLLNNYLEAIADHNPSLVPPNGNVSVAVSNVIMFLKAIMKYQSAFDGIFLLKPSVIQEPDFEKETLYSSNTGYNMTQLSIFMTFAVQSIIVNLKLKSQSYNDPILSHVFLMNNSHWASNQIQSWDIIKYIEPNTYQCLEEITTKSLDSYIKLVWDRAFEILKFDEEHPEPQLGQKFGKRERKLIKRKFHSFSQRIDELCQKHQNYFLKDKKLMISIQNIALQKVNNLYEPFYRKWKDSNFANIPERYISFQPITLQKIIASLYSGEQ